MQNGFIKGWRAGFLAIAVNLLLSIGAAFLPIDDIHISSFIITASYTVFGLCLMLFVARDDLATEIRSMGFYSFNPKLLPLIILFPLAAQFFCSFFTMPVTIISSLLLGFETKEDILTPHNLRSVIIAFGYLCILAPVSEEIIFRGVIYRFFEKHSTLTAIFGSAAVFSAAHLDLRSFIPIFFIGLTLSLVRFSTGSLWATMLAHAAVNLLSLGLMMLEIDMLYTLIMLVLAILFPIATMIFLNTTKFPKLYHSAEKPAVSICMILTIILFCGFQLFCTASNIAEQVQLQDGWFDKYFNDSYGFRDRHDPHNDEYDFFEKFDDEYNIYDYYDFR